MASSGSAFVGRFLEERLFAARLLAFAAGALLTLAYAPFGLFLLAPLAVAALFLCVLASTPRQAAHLGFWFGAGLFLCGTYWLYVSIHDFGKAPLWLALILMLTVVLVMALWFAAFAALCSRLVRGRPWRLLLYAPAAWVAIEWLRGWVLSGFPWLSVGYSQIDSPLAGWLPVAGVYGATLFATVSGAALVTACSQRRRWPALLIGLAPWFAGAALQQPHWTEPAGEPFKVTLVQGGVSQDRKWLPEQFRPTLTAYRGGLLDARDSSIVVWPEVAIPALVEQVEPYLDVVQADVLAAQQTLLLGILEREGERIYNSVLLLDGHRRQVYRKRHLVPFGEYFPVPAFVREWMRLMSLPNSDLSPGADRQPLLTTANGHDIAVAVCYEDAYGTEQLYALPDAELLVNVSNDAWFGHSIAPHQHLEIARVRALEAGRYAVRATNNGISAFIGPDGSLLGTAPQFVFATLSRQVIPMQGATPYSRVGNWPVVLFAFGVLLCGWFRDRH